MFRSLFLTCVIALSAIATNVLASELQTATFQVGNMTCSMCPYTIKKALKQVDGVEQAEAKYEGRGEGWATVTFDPDKTSAEALVRATTNAGYPAHLKEAL